jgi:tetratricopeptide (TPR) repeat protein
MTKVPQAEIVIMAVKYGNQLLEMGAIEQARSNFETAVSLNDPFVSELLSENEAVAKRAAARRLPRGTDLLTYTTSPLLHLSRLLRRLGDAPTAYQVAQRAVVLFGLLAPESAEAAEYLDEAGDIAYQVGDHEYASLCSEQARLIRELIAQNGV